MPSGGKRVGSGRKPTTDLSLTPNQSNLLREKAKQFEDKIVEQLLQLATQGDKAALKTVVEQLYGRPGTQSVEDKPTTIILNCNVPRPPTTNPNVFRSSSNDSDNLSNLQSTGGDHSGNRASVGTGGSGGELPHEPQVGGSPMSDVSDGAGDPGDTSYESEWLQWLNSGE